MGGEWGSTRSGLGQEGGGTDLKDRFTKISSHFSTLHLPPSHNPGPSPEFCDEKFWTWRCRAMALPGPVGIPFPAPSDTPRGTSCSCREHPSSCLLSPCSHGLPSGAPRSWVTGALTPYPTPESAASRDREPGVHVRDAREGVRGDGEAAWGHVGDDPLQREGPAARAPHQVPHHPGAPLCSLLPPCAAPHTPCGRCPLGEALCIQKLRQTLGGSHNSG